MKIVYLGSGEFGINCLGAIEDSEHELAFIVTQPAMAAGRGKRPRPTPAACWAKQHSTGFIEAEDVNSPENVRKIASFEPDLIVVIAFGQKIGNEIINLPPKGAINVHGSLLPKYRGAAPINRAVINGETETGISIITLAEQMDAGLVCGTAKTKIEPNETAGQLHDRLSQIAAPLLIDTLDKIAAGRAQFIEQDHSRATKAPKLKKEDGFLDFSEPAVVLIRKILGFTPWPGASAVYVSKKTGRQQRVTIAMAQVAPGSKPPGLAPGTLDDELDVICGQGALKITRIKPAGGSVMDFKDFANGRATAPGDSFIKIEE